MVYTFQRIEKKYMIDDITYRMFWHISGSHFKPDEHEKYTICNVYYDTEDFALVRASIDKPAYKEKLRLRSYGVPKRTDTVFLELKRKYKGIVYKRRIDLSYTAAERYLKCGMHWGEGSQILREMDYFMQFHTLVPKLYIAYEREAFTDLNDEQLRITFDKGIRIRTDALHLEAGDRGTPMLSPGHRLMEIKAGTAYPLWLAHALSDLRIFPTSFSKYGAFYKQHAKDSHESRLEERTRLLCF